MSFLKHHSICANEIRYHLGIEKVLMLSLLFSLVVPEGTVTIVCRYSLVACRRNLYRELVLQLSVYAM